MKQKERFTTEQILQGLHYALDEIGHPCENATFNADTQLYPFFEEHLSGFDTCPLEILEEVAWYFGVDWKESRWILWLQYRNVKDDSDIKIWLEEISPTMTFGRLARTIARHAPFIPSKPVTLFGITCKKAGIFKGLCRMPEVAGKSVGPSTPLSEAINPFQASDFIKRANWVYGVKLPEAQEYGSVIDLLTSKRIDVIVPNLAFCFTGIIWILVCLYFIEALQSFMILPVIVGGLFFAFSAKWQMTKLLAKPFQSEIDTFADLSRLIDKLQSDILS